MDIRTIVNSVKWPLLIGLAVIVVTILVVVIFEKLGIGGLLLFSAAVVAFVMFVAGPR